MQFIKPAVEILTPIEGIRGTEILEFIEQAGRTCWKSEGRRETKIAALLADSTFDPDTFLSWEQKDFTSLFYCSRAEKARWKVAEDFVRLLTKAGHESVLEHASVTVRFTCSRAVSHQLIRHRIGAYSQESQRYVDYEKKGHIAFIMPDGLPLTEGYYRWDDGQRGGFEGEYRIGQSLSQLLMEVEAPPNMVACRLVKDELQDQHKEWIRAMQQAEHSYLTLREMNVKPEEARDVLPNATKTEIVATFNLRQWRHVFRERALNPAAQKDIKAATKVVLDKFLNTPLAPVFVDLKDAT